LALERAFFLMNLDLNLTVSVNKGDFHSIPIDLSTIMETIPTMEKLNGLLLRGFILPDLEIKDPSEEKKNDDGPFRGKFVGGSVIAIGFNCFGNMRLVYARADASNQVAYSNQELSSRMELHSVFKQLGWYPSNVKTIDHSRTHISRFLSWN
jgi:hypothetical protein